MAQAREVHCGSPASRHSTSAHDGSLSVENDGDRLPPDKRSLFDAFVTLRKKTKHSRNVGLGLFVAKAIAESHGGTIEARDLADGAGARFEVRSLS